MIRCIFKWIWKCFYGCAGCNNCTPFVGTTQSCLGKMTVGQSGIITQVVGDSIITQRLLDMGFVRGTKVSIIRNAPLGDPMEVEIKGSRVAIRKNEAYFVLVELTLAENEVQCSMV